MILNDKEVTKRRIPWEAKPWTENKMNQLGINKNYKKKLNFDEGWTKDWKGKLNEQIDLEDWRIIPVTNHDNNNWPVLVSSRYIEESSRQLLLAWTRILSFWNSDTNL